MEREAINSIPGAPCPVYVGGILYHSIFQASAGSGISTVWISRRLKDSGDTPVIIRGTAVVKRTWVQQIVAAVISRGRMEGQA
ncbi:MAG: hypothetical protein FWC64_02665 [Treponema sp.]|nr:hypothetical protein [Treponema sp.]